METKQHLGFHEEGVCLIAPIQEEISEENWMHIFKP